MFFAYHERSQPTGEILAAALQFPHGINVASPLEIEMSGEADCLIRWGSRVEELSDNYFDRVLNPAESIALASDKLASLEVMQEAGVPVPDFDTDPEALLERVGYPILGRRRRHARGSDIKLVLQERDYKKRMHHYVQYIPTVREFRVHVSNGEAIRVQGKFLDRPSEAVPHIRNYHHGYGFRTPRRRLLSERLDAACLAVESLGLDFGAVDLLIGDDRGTYILEVNTAPSCSPMTAGAYANSFYAALEDDFDLPGIDLNALDLLNPDAEEYDSEDEEGEDEDEPNY